MDSYPGLTPDQVPKVVFAALRQLPSGLIDERSTLRNLLLLGLDSQFTRGIKEGDSPLAELGNIVTATWEYRDAEGRVGLILVLDNAISYVENTQIAASLTAIRSQILALMDQPGFVKQPSLPMTSDQFVQGTCRVELPLPPPSATPPSERDWAYVNNVRRCYRVYQPPAQFTSVDLIAPADFVVGDIIHRQTSGGGPTVQFWSLCRTHQELINCRRLLVLGQPGIGKTSLMQFFTWQYVNLTGMILSNGTPPPEALLLPVMVSLAGWQAAPDEKPSLVDYIKGFLQNPPGKTYPRGQHLITPLDEYLNPDHLYQQSRLVFFFDDYSRLAYKDRASYERQWAEIRDFANTYDQSAIVIICRAGDYDGRLDECDPEFSMIEIGPWGEEQITTYIQRHAQELAPHAHDPRLLRLADIPLVLRLLVDVVQRKKDEIDISNLLDNFYQLCPLFVDQLFVYSEQTGRGNSALRERVEALLARLAAGLAGEQQQGQYMDWPTMLRYAGPEADAPDLEQLLQIASDATILNINPSSKAIAFEAQLFEDYFALLGAVQATAPAGETATSAAEGPTPIIEAAAPTIAAGLASNQTANVLQSVRQMAQIGLLTTHV